MNAVFSPICAGMCILHPHRAPIEGARMCAQPAKTILPRLPRLPQVLTSLYTNDLQKKVSKKPWKTVEVFARLLALRLPRSSTGRGLEVCKVPELQANPFWKSCPTTLHPPAARAVKPYLAGHA